MNAGVRLRARASRLRDAVPALGIAGVLALLPFSTCLLRLGLGVPCPLCGMTRATLALVHGDVVAASRWHPGVVPLGALAMVTVVVALAAEERTWRAFVRRASLATGVGLVVIWLARALGAFGGPVG